MIIPADVVIPEAKLTRYLLVPKARNDKSKFLARAGFTLENPDSLIAALRGLVASEEATLERVDEYGSFYRVVGVLQGSNGINLSVATIWICRATDSQYQFVTLVPYKQAS